MIYARSDDGFHNNKAALVNGVAWTEAGVALAIVIFRFISRFQNGGIGGDDWWMLFTTVIFLITACLCSWYVSLDVFQSNGASHASGSTAVKAVLILESFGTFVFAPAKTSISLLVLRIMRAVTGRRALWTRRAIVASIALLWAILITVIVMTYCQCRPSHLIWSDDPNDLPAKMANCWSPQVIPNMAIFASAYTVFTDVLLAFLPLVVIYDLEMERKKKVALTIVLGYGLLAAAFGIVKITFMQSLAFSSSVDAFANLLIWLLSEVFVIIVFGSLPPVYLLFYKVNQQRRISERTKAKIKFITNSRFDAWVDASDTAALNELGQVERHAKAASESEDSIGKMAHFSDGILVQTQIDVSTSHYPSKLVWD